MMRDNVADLFDTSEVPDDAMYWDALAERVAARAARQRSASAIEWLGHSRAGWIAAALLLAAALSLVTMPAVTSAERRFGTESARAIAPSDDVGKAIALDDGPPAIGALLLPPTVRGPQ